MTPYEDLLSEYDYLAVEEAKLEQYEGLYSNGCIWIKKDEPENRKCCLLAEEIGHYCLTVGDILDQKKIESQKQELKARKWAFEKLLPICNIMFAIEKGYTTPYDMAEYFNLDEQFVRDCLKYYSFL